jgi:hypothetical protein
MINILSTGTGRCLALSLAIAGIVSSGCQNTPIDLSEGPAPWRMPRPDGECDTYEDALTGGEVFTMYCNQCHNARALAERPFANYQNVAAHMRVRAQLTGTEYAKLMEFLRRFHDVPSPTPPVEPSPKRLIFSQPMAELRDEQAQQAAPANPAQPPGEAAGRAVPPNQPVPAPPVQAEPIPGVPAAAALPGAGDGN